MQQLSNNLRIIFIKTNNELYLSKQTGINLSYINWKSPFLVTSIFLCYYVNLKHRQPSRSIQLFIKRSIELVQSSADKQDFKSQSREGHLCDWYCCATRLFFKRYMVITFHLANSLKYYLKGTMHIFSITVESAAPWSKRYLTGGQ